jgi:alkylation response protein AidB-like acyl-CoA dehydrogenase
MLDIEWSAAEKSFRDEVREFFRRELPEPIRAAGRLMTSVYADHDASMAWQRVLVAKGWAAPAWPVQYGGCDWTVAQHYIFARERSLAGAPPLSPMGIQMCAPALIAFGTEEQKNFYLPRMLSGEHFWCQGYSEPESGSDLASLRMSAVVHGNDFICNGSKIWTTHADVANWIFCLVRTSVESKPQLGITFLLIDMSSPGIRVEPIISPAGEHIQNQVLFSDVLVPRANVVGAVGAGWTVAKYLLEFERGGVAYAPELQTRLDDLCRFSGDVPGPARRPLLDDPLFAARVAQARVRVAALEILELRAMTRLAAGHTPGATASVMKILGTELRQRVTELELDAAGNYGRAYQPSAGRPGGAVAQASTIGPVGPLAAALAPLRYLNERAGTIYAGSNEIQRNILAKTVLSHG